MSRNKIRQERVANCPFCNKEIKRGLGYYRNGKYYCNKSHYKKYKEKLIKEKNELETQTEKKDK